MIKDFNNFIDKSKKLPRNIVDLDNFRKSSYKEPKKLLNIINDDLTLKEELLKIVKFDFIDFKENKRNIVNLIKITNLEFITSLCTAIQISSIFPKNLFAYAITKDEFLYSNVFSIYFTNYWLSKIDKKLRSKVLLPAFLKNISKPIISLTISKNRSIEQFLEEAINTNIENAEEKFIGFKSSILSSNILKSFELSHNLILPISYSNNLEEAPSLFLTSSTVLYAIDNISNPKKLLNEEDILKSVEVLKSINFETEQFLEAINEIKSSISRYIN
ncbi:hypothetical protein AAX29_00363 [Aliarcobacter thereius]|uniref:HDOD domain-containing protein n=1 Tax=Aliarcobacter thereius TaxID=544718 RepID=A0A1C0B9U6_9BACT|nr:HDOD domain-containing protein [Aliarcobacter thereius]OCM00360.1 hypothetical protein AAX29_00363 [Aliarcobacter thereius]HJE03050.1 HDOD domain-containing protein [Aliarcobacter thereius]